MRSNSRLPARLAAVLSLACLLALLGAIAGRRAALAPPLLVGALSCLALSFWGSKSLKKFAFTIWVLASVAASLAYPRAFDRWLGYDLKNLIVPLIQVITFGMGTTLSWRDFQRVFAMPWPVLLGVVLQFSVMPLAGYALATLLEFPPEVAAGIILIGSVSGGVASNLMTYLGGGNVALSVTMTACSTMLSPLLTPFLMKVLAGHLVPIDFLAMMLEILNMVIVPILAGLVANKILYSPRPELRQAGPLFLVCAAGAGVAALSLVVPWHLLGPLASIKAGIFLGSSLVSLVALARWALRRREDNWMDKTLPLVSMLGICFIIAIITSRSSESLRAVGLSLIAAAVAHNSVGYLLGYWIPRALRLPLSTCRTVSFEVGMQNGGMASGLAMSVLHSPSAALAPAIFGPWMNVSGSILATWWRRKPLPASRKECGIEETSLS